MIEKISGLELPIIWTDNQRSFYTITRHLLELGHKKIIFIGTSIDSISSESERYKGFCQAHIDFKVPLLAKHRYSRYDADSLSPQYKPDLDFGHRAIHYLFDILEDLPVSERPTAIAAVNDFIAEMIISVAFERHISIPDDYSVTGFDDRTFASYLSVPLTTIAQPTNEIGRIAALELFERIKSPLLPPVNRKLDGQLIIRKSTQKPLSKVN
ncbi:MAG: LacI family transcriptional regulator [Promethearchaeota archaeon]|nr:MAG: LacI family transcriptional regulator [Candidatus Lokiarchaeota archaeon]